MKKYIIAFICILTFTSRTFSDKITIKYDDFFMNKLETITNNTTPIPPDSILIDFSSINNTKGIFNKFSFIPATFGNVKVAKFFKKEHGISFISSQNILGIQTTSSVYSIYTSFIASRLDKGTTIARFYSIVDENKNVELRIENSKIVAKISGIVLSKEGDNIEILLISDEKIKVNEPYEVSLIFDVVNSKVSLYVNGIESDRKIVKPSNFDFNISEGIVEFFTEFFGYAKEIIITPSYLKTRLLNKPQTQEFLSKIIDTKEPSTTVQDISVLGEGTFIIFARSSSNIYDLLKENSQWVALTSSQRVKGRYLQFKVIPVLEEKENKFLGLEVDIQKDIPPIKPTVLFAVSKNDGQITIHWRNDLDDEIDHYEIFYGDYENKYFGKDAENGKSPIKVKKPTKLYPVFSYTLRGLIPNKVYYISIRSVRKDGTKSEYSDEIKTIPSKNISLK